MSVEIQISVKVEKARKLKGMASFTPVTAKLN